jgi:hypothetical protein
LSKEKFIGCSIKSLPPALAIEAASTARLYNPANAPLLRRLVQSDEAEEAMNRIISNPIHIAMLHQKYWGPGGVLLTVGFMDQTSAELRNKIIQYMNVWNKAANILFTYTANLSEAKVRIAFERSGYWSYLGTDILHIPRNQQTMNLEAFSMRTSYSEFMRVVTHETFHTCGGPHEHMRKELVDLLDPQKTIRYFGRTQGWSANEVRAQVLTPLTDITSEYSTPADQDSIMCYQIPGECTKSGKPIHGGVQPNPTDLAFAAKMYPKPGGPTPPDNILLSKPEQEVEKIQSKRYSVLIESDSPISVTSK